jgi:MarR family transcriptional regulator, transcriptional regulator for hemolysin
VTTSAPAQHRSRQREPTGSAAIPIEELERLVYEGVAVTARALAASPAASDLTLAQWRVLALVDRSPQPLTLTEVAAGIGMSLPSASRMVARLDGRGLVRCRADTVDRRAMRIAVTAAGFALAAEVLETRRSILQGALGEVTVAPTFGRDVDRVVAALVQVSVREQTRGLVGAEGGTDGDPNPAVQQADPVG